jgi:hypothetical protein
MYLHQVHKGVNEFLTNPHEAHDDVIDRAISRLNTKITGYFWMGNDYESWDITRLFIKLREIRNDHPSLSNSINDDMHMIVSNLAFRQRPFIPQHLHSLIGLETSEFDNALGMFNGHVLELADQGLLNP